MDVHGVGIARAETHQVKPLLGVPGHLAIFAWFLGMVMLVPASKIVFSTAVCLAVVTILYPHAIQRSLRLRWMAWMFLLALPSLFFLGEIDAEFFGLGYSSAGLLASLQIAMRFMVVLVAVQSFTSVVAIPELGGLLEGIGMRGLGFSIGVAMNLLPYLQESSQQAWQSLRMRGGLRSQWMRGLRLLLMTIVANALRRAEEVALAAEARAFSPENAHPLPVRQGKWDWPIAALGLAILLAMIVL